MKGVYALVVSVERKINPEIGSLGKIKFSPGKYVYLGSAQNNLEKRVGRHLKWQKPAGGFHWHIDYLLGSPGVRVEEVFWRKGPKEDECRMAGMFSDSVKGFGCSDCSCESHLALFEPDILEKEMERL